MSAQKRCRINVSKTLEEQNLRKSTIVILAILDMNYWCESEEEKKRLYKVGPKMKKKQQSQKKGMSMGM